MGGGQAAASPHPSRTFLLCLVAYRYGAPFRRTLVCTLLRAYNLLWDPACDRICTQIQERSATLPKDAAGQGSTVRHVVRHGSDPCPELLPSQSARGGAGWFLRLPLAVWGLKEGRIVSTQSLPWPEFAAFNVGPIPIPLSTCRQKGADAPAARGLHEDVPGVLQAAVARRPGSVLELAGEVTLNYGHHTAEPSPLLF